MLDTLRARSPASVRCPAVWQIHQLSVADAVVASVVQNPQTFEMTEWCYFNAECGVQNVRALVSEECNHRYADNMEFFGDACRCFVVILAPALGKSEVRT